MKANMIYSFTLVVSLILLIAISCEGKEERKKTKSKVSRIKPKPELRVKNAGCDAASQEACKVNGTANTCKETPFGYLCKCQEPYKGIAGANGNITSCVPESEGKSDEKECTAKQKENCTVEVTGKLTGNNCTIGGDGGYECECKNLKYMPVEEHGSIIKCVASKEQVCEEDGLEKCQVADDNDNECLVPDSSKPEEFECKCVDPYENGTKIEDKVTECKKSNESECDEKQKKDCATQNEDGNSTNNTCKVPVSGDESSHVCICDEETYTSIEDANGIVYMCNLTAVCDQEDQDNCKVNSTSNKCIVKEEGYVCECVDPYHSIMIESKEGCEMSGAECDRDQKEKCMLQTPMGEITQNMCVVPDKSKPDEHVCTCGDDGYEPVIKDDVVKECKMKDLIDACNPEQKRKCKIGIDDEDNTNQCIIQDASVPTDYECVCEGLYIAVIDKNTNKAIGCKLADSEECSEEQSLYCMVFTSDQLPTHNKCEQLDENPHSDYTCRCEDVNYQEVKNYAGLVVNCTRRQCDKLQEAACNVDLDSETGNICSLETMDDGSLNPDEYECTCSMPYFPSLNDIDEPICDKLPPGEFYIHKPQDTTVVQGHPTVIDCILDRAVNICQWERGGRKITPSLYPNATSGSSRYTLVGDGCDGVCSVRINAASLTHDNTTWTCKPLLEGEDIPPVSAEVTVIVAPERPWLEYDGKILENKATVYVPFYLARTKRILVKCVSKSAYPPAKHSWSQDGKKIRSRSKSEYIQDTMADTITTITSASFIMNKSNGTIIRCGASSNDQFYQSVSAAFASTAPTTFVRILHFVDGDWFLPPHGLILLDHPEETMLKCVADGHPEPFYTWQEEIEEKWQPVGYLESYLITTHSRTLRCMAGNNENDELIASWPVIIQSKGSGDQRGPITGLPHVPVEYKFIVEPSDHVIGPGANFELNCKVNGPVHTCLWTRRDLLKNELGSLPEFIFTGHRNLGYCTIRIKHAAIDSLGSWLCQPILYDGNVLVSTEATVTGLYFTMFSEDSGDAWRFRPHLTVNGYVATRTKLAVLNRDDPTKTSVDVVAECNAYSSTNAGEIQWKLGDANYRKYTSSRLPIPSKPLVYLISSKVDFILNSDLKTSNVPHSLMMELGCRVVGRQIIDNSSANWVNLEEMKTTLTLHHPTFEVVVIPQGPIDLSKQGSVLLICHYNGFPPPSIQWQEYYSDHEVWLKIPHAYSASLLVPRTGLFRCTVGNSYNKNGRIPSKYVRVIYDDAVQSSGSARSSSLATVFGCLAVAFLLSL